MNLFVISRCLSNLLQGMILVLCCFAGKEVLMGMGKIEMRPDKNLLGPPSLTPSLVITKCCMKFK